MPSVPPHIFESQQWEVRLSDRAHAADVQDRVSQLARGELSRQAEAICFEACPPDLSCRIPRLVLDLGTVSRDHLEDELLARFGAAFRDALAELNVLPGTRANTPSRAGLTRHAAGSPAEVLAHLLERGTMPWWAADQATSLETLVLNALDGSAAVAAAATASIRRLGQAAAVRRRLARQLSPTVLARVVEHLQPADADFILGYKAAVERHQERTRLVPATTRELRAVTWELILDTLLATRGSHFNRKQFLADNLRALAQRFRVGYPTLLRLFLSPADAVLRPGQPLSLLALLRELHDETPDEDDPAGPGGGHDAPWPAEPEPFEASLTRCLSAGGSQADRRHVRAAWHRLSPADRAALWSRLSLRVPATGLAAAAGLLDFSPPPPLGFVGEPLDATSDTATATAVGTAGPGTRWSVELDRFEADLVRHLTDGGSETERQNLRDAWRQLAPAARAALWHQLSLRMPASGLAAELLDFGPPPLLASSRHSDDAAPQNTAPAAAPNGGPDVRHPAGLGSREVAVVDQPSADGAGYRGAQDASRQLDSAIGAAADRPYDPALAEPPPGAERPPAFGRASPTAAVQALSPIRAPDGAAAPDAATSQASLGRELERHFASSANGGTIGPAAIAARGRLWREWLRQPRSWQTAYWETLHLRLSADVIGAGIVTLFPPAVWERVQQSLPRPFAAAPLRAVAEAVGTLPGSRQGTACSPTLATWWRRVFAAALRAGGERHLRSPASLRALLVATLANDDAACRLAVDQLLRGPAVRADAHLHRALVALARGPARIVRHPLDAPRLRLDPEPGLSLLNDWLRGVAVGVPADRAMLPGGPEALLARLHLYHPAATAQWVRRTLADPSARHAVLSRATPAVRHRLLAVLAPRAAPLLDAYLSTAIDHRAALLGRPVGRISFEAFAWAAVMHGLTHATGQPEVQVTLAVQAHWRAIARQHHVAPDVLRGRWQALLRGDVIARPPVALAAWARRLARSGGGRPPLPASRLSTAVREDLVARLAVWRRLLDPATGPLLSEHDISALWTSAVGDARAVYAELLDASPPDHATVARVAATGGEAFLLRVATEESAAWRTEFTGWLDLIGSVAGRAAILPFPAREWRGRALADLVRLRRTGPVRGTSPVRVALELLRRTGVHAHAGGHWRRATRAAAPGILPGLAGWRSLPEEEGLAVLLLGWTAHMPSPVSPRARTALERVARPTLPAARPRRPAPPPKPRLAVAPGPRHPSLPEPADPLFVENAGLVMLTPFLGRYLETHGLLTDGVFRDEAAAERAVHLLQALLTDDQPVPEQFLALNKVLCGLPPDTPVPRTIDFSPHELATAHTVLTSAATAWRGAGSLSNQGLRNSFLIRRGKLVRGDERWTLTVEQRAYDVLLTSLPWGFSVVKRRWMPDPLYVEWV